MPPTARPRSFRLPACLLGAARHVLLLATLATAIATYATTAHGADWVRAGINTDQPIWGMRGGLQFAIPPGGFSWGTGGPRGLIRIGYPTLPEGGCDLINFIAIEPVVKGSRGLSELERSSINQGKGN